MAHSLSSKKRHRQNGRRRVINRARKSILKSKIRKFEELIHDQKGDEAAAALRATVQKLDKVAADGTIHPNKAARKKSRLQKKLNQLQASAS